MKFSDLFLQASSNLLRKKFRSLLTMSGVVIGCLLVIIILSISSGFNDFLVASIKSFSAPRVLMITHSEGLNGLKIMNAGMRSIGTMPRQVSENETFYSFKLIREDDHNILLKIPHVTNVKPLPFVLIDSIGLVGQENRFELFAANWIAEEPLDLMVGEKFTSSNAAEIILTPEYATVFGKSPEELIGKTVILELGQPLENFRKLSLGLRLALPKAGSTSYKATIRGFTDYKIFTSLCWLPEEFAVILARESLPFRQLYTKELTGLVAKIVVDSHKNVETVKESLKKLKYTVISQSEALGALEHFFSILELIFSLFAFVALTVAALGIINTLVTSANERQREIAVMMAVGACRSDVRHLFAVEGATIGFWGASIAIVIGNTMGFITNLVVAANWPRVWSGHHIFAYQFWLIPALLLGASVLGFIAGLYPAHRASKLNPVEVLRYN